MQVLAIVFIQAINYVGTTTFRVNDSIFVDYFTFYAVSDEFMLFIRFSLFTVNIVGFEPYFNPWVECDFIRTIYDLSKRK